MSTAHNTKGTRSKTESSRQLQATKRKWCEIVMAVELLFVKKTIPSLCGSPIQIPLK